MVEKPAVVVWHLDRLPDELGNIWEGKTLTESARQGIMEKLTKLCQAQVEASKLA